MPTPSLHTDFPGGRLGEAGWLAPGHLRAAIYREWDHERVNTQSTWYYFRLDGVRDVPLTIEITGLDDRYEGRPSHSIAERDKPFISVDGVRWERFTTSEFDRERCTLTLKLTPEADTLWVAHLEPYTEEHLARLAQDHAESPYLRTESAGPTVEGREIPFWTITDPVVPDGGKKVVWLMGRQHAWETHTSWCLDGLVRFVLGGTPEAADLRRRFIWRILPLMDPDGVARGGTRFNKHGYDINRHWDAVPVEPLPGQAAASGSPSPVAGPPSSLVPEIVAGKGVIRDWLAAGRRIDLFLSFHDTQNDVLLLAPELVDDARISRLLEGMHAIRFAGKARRTVNPSTVETALYREYGFLAALVELGTVDLPTYGRYVTAEDRVRFGAELAGVIGRVLKDGRGDDQRGCPAAKPMRTPSF